MNASEGTNVGSTSSHRRLADVLTHHRQPSKLPRTRLVGGGQKLVTGMPAVVLRLYGAGKWQRSSAGSGVGARVCRHVHKGAGSILFLASRSGDRASREVKANVS